MPKIFFKKMKHHGQVHGIIMLRSSLVGLPVVRNPAPRISTINLPTGLWSSGVRIVVVLCLFSLLLIPKIVGAAEAAPEIPPPAAGPGIPTTITGDITEFIKSINKNIETTWKTAAINGLRAAADFVLRTMLTDVFTYIETGDKGQKPLFFTNKWEEYLQDVGSEAGGAFLDKLSTENGFGKFNLCQPDPRIALKISLGLKRFQKPGKPRCNLKEIRQNWENLADDPNLLSRINQDILDPFSNDLGIAFSANTGMFEAIADKKEAEAKNREEEEGHKKTPSGQPGVAKEIADQAQSASTKAIVQPTWTGELWSDIKEGLKAAVMLRAQREIFKKLSRKPKTEITNSPEAQVQYEGKSEVSARLAKAFKSEIEASGSFDILAQLSSCPDEENPGPTNCVITSSFQSAIQNKMTVKQAMDEGIINKDLIFGYHKDGTSVNYKEGLPPRSIFILKKYGIVPIGWEIALSKLNPKAEYTLEDLTVDVNFKELVDPNWILSVREQFCKKEGSGARIISTNIIPGSNANKTAQDNDFNDQNDSLPSQTIIRDSGYCADSQSCIKENKDGSCAFFGYCTEDKKIWKFTNTSSCEPYYHTCETFESREGATVSYLTNSLDYTNCDANSVGCRAYSVSQSPVGTWDVNNLKYFNKNIENCDSTEEGCSRFIRTKAGLGANLIIDSGFENLDPSNNSNPSVSANSSSLAWEAVSSNPNDPPNVNVFRGNKSLKVAVSANEGGIRFKPLNNNFIDSSSGYTFSANIKVITGEVKARFFSGNAESAPITSSGAWTKIFVTIPAIKNSQSKILYAEVYGPAGAEFYIDNAQLAAGENLTAYNDYNGENARSTTYFRKAPDYYNCYNDGNSENNIFECNNFINECRSEEVGCQLYTSINNNEPGIPGRVTPSDYCPAECVGYQTYKQEETFFDHQGAFPVYLIASRAVQCSAEQAGCDEFTNLDKAEKRGEAREYYTYLRMCQKPGPSSNAYYTWQGSDTTGFQLKSWNLVALGEEGDPAAGPPKTIDNSGDCSSDIANPDCREFYDTRALRYYRYWTKTITSSEDCFAYRKTVSNSANCLGTGGTWNANTEECIYNAIPLEGIACSANNNTCRAYKGNNSNNIRILFTDTFETGTDNWNSGSLSTESVKQGEHSLSVQSGIDKNVSQLIAANKTYVLKFWAKGSGAIRFGFTSLNSDKFSSATGPLSSEWREYNLGPVQSAGVSSSEKLLIQGFTGTSYIDNIILTEITDKVYLRKDSVAASVPQSCDQDHSGNPSSQAMLNCNAYTDSDSQTKYIKSFEKICKEKVLGCEALIYTKNSASYSDDNLGYYINSEDKRCPAQAKACVALGLQSSQSVSGKYKYDLVFKKNDPDKIDNISCKSENNFCESFVNEGGGQKYFKNPGDKVCEYKQVEDQGKGWGWYKKGSTEKCSVTNQLALEPNIEQPSSNAGWAGTCPSDASSCTEFLDPLSDFSNNEVQSNADLTQDNDRNNVPDGWDTDGTQKVRLEADALYIFSHKNISGGATLSCDNGVNVNLASAVLTYVRFYNPSGTTCTVKVSPFRVYAQNEKVQVAVRKALVSYVLGKDIDRKSCAGIKDDNKGCVLFNERSVQVNNTGVWNYAPLAYSAENTLNGRNPTACSSDNNVNRSTNSCDSNVLLKVTADRACNEWLYCTDKAVIINEKGQTEHQCQAVGLCNQLSSSGTCISTSSNLTQPIIDENYAKSNPYTTGYVVSNMLSIDQMSQEKQNIDEFNGGFEDYEFTLPTDTNPNRKPGLHDWNKSDYTLIIHPAGGPNGAQYETGSQSFKAYEGKNFLMLNGGKSISSVPLTSHTLQTSYMLSGYVATDAQVTATVSVTGVQEGSPSVSKTDVKNWTLVMLPFTTTNIAKTPVQVHLRSDGGKSYFDGFQIKPVLRIKPGGPTDTSAYVTNSCRLHPKQEALACSYKDEDYQYRGWEGYCLQYDPENKNVCLLWYPVDLVRGDLSGGYTTGFQTAGDLYYCTKTALMEYRSGFNWESGWVSNCEGEEPTHSGYTCVKTDCVDDSIGYEEYAKGSCSPSDGVGYYLYDSGLNNNESGPYVFCTEFTRVAKSGEENKAWVQRVAFGSTSTIPVIGYTYSQLPGAPFGAVLNSPNNISTDKPTLLNGTAGPEAVKGVWFKSGSDNKAAPFTCNINDTSSCLNPSASLAGPAGTLNSIFNQSYGSCVWKQDGFNGNTFTKKFDNNGYYECTSTGNILSIPSPCPNNIRSDPNSWCSVQPTVSPDPISNKFITPITGKSPLSVTLRFHYHIDPEQLGKDTSFTVDWGDGTQPSKLSKYASFTHVYTCPSSSCSYTPRIRVTDHWGKCNSQSGNQSSGCSLFPPDVPFDPNNSTLADTITVTSQ